MNIIEIIALSNSAHRNQNGSISYVPEGWAVIPEGMEIPSTFPFVNITVENGIVTAMTANQEAYDKAMEENKETEKEPTIGEVLDVLLGVDE